MSGKSSPGKERMSSSGILESIQNAFVLLIDTSGGDMPKLLRLKSMLEEEEAFSKSFVTKTCLDHITNNVKLQRDFYNQEATNENGHVLLTSEMYSFCIYYADIPPISMLKKRIKLKIAFVVEFYSDEREILLIKHIARTTLNLLTQAVQLLVRLTCTDQINTANELALNQKFVNEFDSKSTMLLSALQGRNPEMYSFLFDAFIPQIDFMSLPEKLRKSYMALFEKFESSVCILERKTGRLLYNTVLQEDGSLGSLRMLYLYLIFNGALDVPNFQKKKRSNGVSSTRKGSGDFMMVEIVDEITYFIQIGESYILCIERDKNLVSKQSAISLNLLPATQLMVEFMDITERYEAEKRAPTRGKGDLLMRMNVHTAMTVHYPLFWELDDGNPDGKHEARGDVPLNSHSAEIRTNIKYRAIFRLYAILMSDQHRKKSVSILIEGHWLTARMIGGHEVIFTMKCCK